MSWIVNIRGTNGSGKSSIPISMLNDPKMYVIEKPFEGKMKKILTVFPSYQWVTMGVYSNKCGGLDNFPNTDFIKKVLWYALKKFPEYNLLMEGIMTSTVYSTYRDLFKQVEEKYPERRLVIVTLFPPVETCIKRVQKRNGGKPVKENLICDKYRVIKNAHDKFTAEGFETILWDNRGCMNKDKPGLIFQLEDLIIAHTPEIPRRD